MLAGILLASCSRVWALNPALDVRQYGHTSWNVRGGFTKGEINAIAQTPDGYLWLGTQFGLLRFDGVRNVPFQAPGNQQLPSNHIYSLLTSRDGTLWIGTAKGLASWKDAKLTSYAELADKYIFELLEDHEGTVWIGAAGVPTGRLCSIKNDGVKCSGDDGSLGRAVVGLFEDSKGNLWAGVDNGLWRWQPGQATFYPLPGESNGIRALGEDVDGTLLVGWNGGIQRFNNGKTETHSNLRDVGRFTAKALLRDRDGGLWIGTQDRGIVHLHQGRVEVFGPSDGLSGESVDNIFEDREGNIWVATVSGLDRFRDFAVVSFNENQGLSGSVVASVLASGDGSVWLGTFGGLNRWQNGQLTLYGNDTAQPITGTDKSDQKPRGLIAHSLLRDHLGRLWVSTFRGVGYLKNNRFVLLSGVPGGTVLSMVEDKPDDLWILNENIGLIHVLHGTKVEQISWAALGHKDHASTLISDPIHGGLWLGFFLGGIVYLNDGQVRASYTANEGLGEGHVNYLRVDQHGTLWAATDGGLSRLKNGRIATLTTKNGLPCDQVHWATEDDVDSFWLYTACGLVRIQRSELNAWSAAVEEDSDAKPTIHVTVFDSSDGVRILPAATHYSPQVSKSADGRLWFVGVDGVRVIDPRNLHENKLPPPVHIEQVIADRKIYDAAQGLSLPPLLRDLQIDYTALSLVAPEKVRFRVKLEGWDADWKDVGTERKAFYSNLPPRNYRFRVMACNNSGVWNEEGAFLDFTIAPAFYQTNWFRALAVAAFLALLFALYRLRVSRLRAQERKLRDVVETIPTIAWTAQPNGSIDFVNRTWREYSGFSAGETAGSGWQNAVHPEDLGRHLKRWRASLNDGGHFESEVRFRRADGVYRWFLARAVPLRDARGQIVKWYGSSTDIEERKRAEEERERVRQLEAELAHINRVSTLGELTASLAHEIKQPITATITSASAGIRWLTREQPNVEEARNLLESIKRDGERTTEIVARLKSFYKKEDLREHERVDINEVVEEMLLLMRSEANRWSVVIRTELAVGLPPVWAHRVQLQQVLMNLVLNAIEAMKEMAGEVTIRSCCKDGHVLVSVSDAGTGIPEGKMDKIFDSFFTTKAAGTGMGLSISRTIIDAHGGGLWAENNSGRGATFYFTLPAEACQD